MFFGFLDYDSGILSNLSSFYFLCYYLIVWLDDILDRFNEITMYRLHDELYS